VRLYHHTHLPQFKFCHFTCIFVFCFFCFPALGQPFSNKQTTIEWSTHFGLNGPLFKSGYFDPSGTAQKLQSLGADGSTVGDLVADTVGTSRVGDLVELGFFDLDTNTGDTVYTPNATDDLFKGTWTPITSLTTIGQQNSGTAVGAGYFGFETVFSDHDSYLAGHDNVANTNSFTSGANYIIDDDTPTNLRYMVEGLNGVSNANIGIRFYDVNVDSITGLDADGKTSSSTRYNTIMNTGWDWVGKGNDMVIGLYDNSNTAVLQTGLEFEFDNTTYGDNGSYTALIGTGGTNSVSDATADSTDTDDFVATVTYYDGSSGLTLSNSGIGDTILSGLSGAGDLNGANDGNQLTLHSNTGRDDVFTGTITNGGSNVTDLTILKTGSGGQTFTGKINTADSDNTTNSGYLNIGEGTVVLNPASSSITQKVGFITGAGTLKLDNENSNAQVIELGFANTVKKKTFSGAITLQTTSGSEDTNSVSVGGTTNADAHQEFSGAISGTNKFKKAGIGKLTLSGDSNGYAGDGTDGITIGDSSANGGILVAADNDALGSNDVTIAYGKLAVAGGVTVTNTIVGESSTSQKSIVGGGSGTSFGTITNGGAVLNFGSGSGEIDVVSPGIAQATSMTNGTSDNQVITGDHDANGVDTLDQSIGIVKINNVGLKSGGVYDWEIANFAGSTPGTDWDVLRFDDLAFDSSGNFDINILSLTSNDGVGSGAGAVAGVMAPKIGTSTSGFLFMDGSGSGTINWGGSGGVKINGATPTGDGRIDAGYFNIYSDVFSYNNSNYYGDWSVYLDYANQDFYLQYSVVPEPSTYIMVAGLLMLPGMSYLRRLRKSGSE